jgi:hypothetical protein
MKQDDLFSRIPTVLERVKARVNAARDTATQEQREVLDVLTTTLGKVTQRDLAKRCPMLGRHWREQATAADDETTLRKVRQVVRDLRVELRVPILSDPKGYWLPRTDDEVVEYVDRVEKQARATARAWFETLKSLDGFVDDGRQRALFDVIEAIGGAP